MIGDFALLNTVSPVSFFVASVGALGKSGGCMRFKYSNAGALIGAVASATMSAQGVAAPKIITNAASPEWTLEPEDSDDSCGLSTNLSPASPFDKATIWTSRGRKRIGLSLTGPKRKEPMMRIRAGYKIGAGAVMTYETSSSSARTGNYAVSLVFKNADAKAIYDGAPLNVAVAKTTVISLNTLGLWGRLAAADACERGLLIEAGVPAEMIAQIAEAPSEFSAEIFSASDYPAEAMKRSEQGTTRVLVMIGVDGGAKECRVLESSRSPVLDEATCSIIRQRTKLEPGLNRAKTPIEAPLLISVRWELP